MAKGEDARRRAALDRHARLFRRVFHRGSAPPASRALRRGPALRRRALGADDARSKAAGICAQGADGRADRLRPGRGVPRAGGHRSSLATTGASRSTRSRPLRDVPEWRLAVVLEMAGNEATIGLRPGRDVDGKVSPERIDRRRLSGPDDQVGEQGAVRRAQGRRRDLCLAGRRTSPAPTRCSRCPRSRARWSRWTRAPAACWRWSAASPSRSPSSTARRRRCASRARRSSRSSIRRRSTTATRRPRWCSMRRSRSSTATARCGGRRTTRRSSTDRRPCASASRRAAT